MRKNSIGDAAPDCPRHCFIMHAPRPNFLMSEEERKSLQDSIDRKRRFADKIQAHGDWKESQEVARRGEQGRKEIERSGEMSGYLEGCVICGEPVDADIYRLCCEKCRQEEGKEAEK